MSSVPKMAEPKRYRPENSKEKVTANNIKSKTKVTSTGDTQMKSIDLAFQFKAHDFVYAAVLD